MVNEPIIQVKENANVTKAPDGLAGKVAIIGNFKTTEDETPVKSYVNYSAFLEDYPETETNTDDFKSIKQLFKQYEDSRGVTDILIKNEGSPITTSTQFASLLESIEGESFDILMIPTPLPATKTSNTYDFDELLKTWLSTRFANQAGVGVVFAYEQGTLTVTELSNRLNSFNRGVYGCPLQCVNDLSLSETIGFYTNKLAGRKLNKSTTSKIMDGLNSLDTEYNFKSNDDGYVLMNAGFTLFKCFDRRNSRYKCVRAYTPAGYDVSQERTADYMTRAFALDEFLGDSSNTITMDTVNGEVTNKIHTFVDELNLCDSIEASVEKVTANKVEVNLKYVFDGIIDNITLYITIEEI